MITKLGQQAIQERGASMLEYVMALAVLIMAFVIGGIILQRSSRERASASMTSTGNVIPHVTDADTLCTLGPDACK
ncbi:MAG: hypothetical protein J0M12_15075 [Deltaproteobacteria bacterium]|nr:hypothetical protein [Deltaproteobacteria bacterium]